MDIKGKSPLPRSGHASVLVGNSLYIFGGQAKSKKLEKDHKMPISRFDFGTSPSPLTIQHSTITQQGTTTTATSHNSSPYSRTDTSTWCKLKASGAEKPLPVSYHGAVMSHELHQILIFGGRFQEVLYNTIQACKSSFYLFFEYFPTQIISVSAADEESGDM